MHINLSVIKDEKNKLDKTIHDQQQYSGTLRAETSVINPTVLIEAENLAGYNYMRIPQFDRYYYITDIVCVRNGLWRVSGHVDVLMSYREEIEDIPIIISDSETTKANNYLNGDVWRTLVKTKTDIVNFSNGLNNSGEYILITSGG